MLCYSPESLNIYPLNPSRFNEITSYLSFFWTPLTLTNSYSILPQRRIHSSKNQPSEKTLHWVQAIISNNNKLVYLESSHNNNIRGMLIIPVVTVLLRMFQFHKRSGPRHLKIFIGVGRGCWVLGILPNGITWGFIHSGWESLKYKV